MASNKGKQKGNKYERDVARKLSLWMFNDSEALWRNSSSGARGYKGDIVPYKPIPWKRWPFLVEVKAGYLRQMPKGLSYPNIVEEWLIKACNQLGGQQEYVLLIIKFHRCRDVLITTKASLIKTRPYFIFLPNSSKVRGYVYDFATLLASPFHKTVNMRILKI